MTTLSALPTLDSRFILGVRADPTNYLDASRRVFRWAGGAESRYVCMSNVHVTMESYDSADYRALINAADLVNPDGMPLVWALRLFGARDATQVRGPTLVRRLLAQAAADGVAVGFYGGTQDVLGRILGICHELHPDLHVAYAHAPPFRPLTEAEDAAVVRDINQSGARLLFVGLGCPKQERWMAAHKGSVHGVMLGVGAAFDFLAGAKPEAPMWMRRAGLEWCFRLASEPRRLWWRYAYHNPRFVARLLEQYFTSEIQ